MKKNEKEEVIETIIESPIKYAIMMHLYKNETWDKEKLEYMDIQDIKWVLRDVKTFIRNEKQLNGTGY